MVRRGPVEAEGSPHHETAQRQGAYRCQPARTTRPLRGREVLSRGAGGSPPRCQVTPFIGLISRVRLVGGVACVELGPSISSEQCRQRLVDQRRVGNTRPHAASASQQLWVHRGAQTYAVHAIIMAHVRSAMTERSRVFGLLRRPYRNMATTVAAPRNSSRSPAKLCRRRRPGRRPYGLAPGRAHVMGVRSLTKRVGVPQNKEAAADA